MAATASGGAHSHIIRPTTPPTFRSRPPTPFQDDRGDRSRRKRANKPAPPPPINAAAATAIGAVVAFGTIAAAITVATPAVGIAALVTFVPAAGFVIVPAIVRNWEDDRKREAREAKRLLRTNSDASIISRSSVSSVSTVVSNTSSFISTGGVDDKEEDPL